VERASFAACEARLSTSMPSFFSGEPRFTTGHIMQSLAGLRPHFQASYARRAAGIQLPYLVNKVSTQILFTKYGILPAFNPYFVDISHLAHPRFPGNPVNKLSPTIIQVARLLSAWVAQNMLRVPEFTYGRL